MQSIAANEVHHQKHRQSSRDHHADGNAQPDKQIGEIVNLPDHVRTQNPAEELRREHIDSNRRSMRAAGHQIVDHRGHRSVIPGHEERRGEECNHHGEFLLRRDGPQEKWRGAEESRGNGEDASGEEALLQQIGNRPAGQNAEQQRDQQSRPERNAGLAQAEVLVADQKVCAPGDERDAGKRDHNAARDERHKRRHSEQQPQRNRLGPRPARRLRHSHYGEHKRSPGNTDINECAPPAKGIANHAAQQLSRGSAQQHSGGEDGLRAGSALQRERAGNHGLPRRRIRGFAHADQSARRKEHRECGCHAAENGCCAGEDHSEGDHARAAPAVGKQPEGNAGNRQHRLQDDLQQAKLRARCAKLASQQRHQRRHNAAFGKVDKVNQSEYSEYAELVCGER